MSTTNLTEPENELFIEDDGKPEGQLIKTSNSNKLGNCIDKSKKPTIKNINEDEYDAADVENIDVDKESGSIENSHEIRLDCQNQNKQVHTETNAWEQLKNEQLELEKSEREYCENERFRGEQLEDERLEVKREQLYNNRTIKVAALELTLEMNRFQAREQEKHSMQRALMDNQKNQQLQLINGNEERHIKINNETSNLNANYELKISAKTVSHCAKKDKYRTIIPDNEWQHMEVEKLTDTIINKTKYNIDKISSARESEDIGTATTANFNWTYPDKSASPQSIDNAASITIENCEWKWHDDNPVPLKYPDRPVPSEETVNSKTVDLEWNYPNRPVPHKPPDNTVSSMTENFEWKYLNRPVPHKPPDNTISSMTENFEWKYSNRPVPPKPLDDTVSSMTANFEWKYPDRPIPRKPPDDTFSSMTANFEWKYPDRPVPRQPPDDRNF